MEITREEYTELIRRSEKLRILEDYLSKEKYISSETIKVILG